MFIIVWATPYPLLEGLKVDDFLSFTKYNKGDRTMPLKGMPAHGRHAKNKPRPNAWVSGPDPVRHKQYRVWLQQRNQARYRGETWELTFESWLDKWKEHWPQRGREAGDFCMTRHDIEGPWDDVNAVIMSRLEHHQRHMARQHELGRTRGYKNKGKAK
jgi:hypothetical protein